VAIQRIQDNAKKSLSTSKKGVFLVEKTPNRGVLRPNTAVITPNRGVLRPNKGVITPNRAVLRPNTAVITPNKPNKGVITPNNGLRSFGYAANAVRSWFTRPSDAAAKDRPFSGYAGKRAGVACATQRSGTATTALR